MATSYANAGGTGNRTASITVTTNLTPGGSSTPSNLVDGAFGNNDTDSFWGNSAAASGKYIEFDFGTPKLIDEAKWYQNTTTNQGTWKWQYWDGAAWQDVGGTFSLGTVSGAQTHTSLNGNTAVSSRWRLLGTAGTWFTTPYIQEVEFKIDDGVIPLELEADFFDQSILTVVWFPPLFAEFFDEAELAALSLIVLAATFEDGATSVFLLEGFNMELVTFNDDAEMNVVVDIPDPVPLPIQMITIITGR